MKTAKIKEYVDPFWRAQFAKMEKERLECREFYGHVPSKDERVEFLFNRLFVTGK